MHIPLIPLTICLALIAVVVGANIITLIIVGGGKSSHYAAPVTSLDTDVLKARLNCECPCHQRRSSMYPGMRCMDCYGEICDEGTQQ